MSKQESFESLRQEAGGRAEADASTRHLDELFRELERDGKERIPNERSLSKMNANARPEGSKMLNGIWSADLRIEDESSASAAAQKKSESEDMEQGPPLH